VADKTLVAGIATQRVAIPVGVRILDKIWLDEAAVAQAVGISSASLDDVAS
jgi:hypothetical protein